MTQLNNTYVLEKIRKEISLKDYLESKGIKPVKTLHNGCSLYVCPIHGDTDPSMRVWPSGVGKFSYENYKCFGCKSGNDVVAMYAALDFNDNYGAAIKHLAKSVDCTIEGSIDFLVQEIKRQNQKEESDYYKDGLECYSIKIADLVKSYLKNVEYDKEELLFSEKLFKIIDSYLWSYDLEKLKKSYKFLSEDSGNKKFLGQSALKIRYYNWIKKQEQKKREKFKNEY